MTTIVVDREKFEMAADQQIVDDARKFQTGSKIQRITNPLALLATAGDVANCQDFEFWIKKQLRELNTAIYEKRLWKGKDMKALLLFSDGTLYFFDNGTPIYVADRFFAIGTGGDYALGAITVCHNVKEAVRVASLHDPNSGMGIQYERLYGQEPI